MVEKNSYIGSATALVGWYSDQKKHELSHLKNEILLLNCWSFVYGNFVYVKKTFD